MLIDKLPVCKSIAFEEKEDKAYYLKECIKGKNLCHETILSNPDRLIDILVKVVNLIHNIKNENNESFIHGDLCLPNILVDDKDNVVGIIDLAHSSFSNDLWLDYAWLIWSFEYNLNSKEHTSKLLEKLNITFDENKYNKVINQ